MGTLLVIVYVLSVLVSASAALWLLREELAADRRKVECSWQTYELNVTWLNIVLGAGVVLVPVMNTIVAVVTIGNLLDRPVLSKRKKS